MKEIGKKELVINVDKDCYRIAILENNLLAEYSIEVKDSEFVIGDIFVGEVKKKPNNLEAYFINIDRPRDVFLHIDDFGENTLTFVEFYKHFAAGENVKVSTFEHVKEEKYENKKSEDSFFISNSKKEDIEKNFNLLKIGSKTLVQVVKEPMYNKGAGVATRISIPGKYLVLIPFNNNVCVSRKIKNKDVRDKLCETIQNIVNEFGLNNFGIILRTSSLAFIDVDNEEDFKTKIKQDLLYLLNKWSECLNNLKDATVGTKILSGDSRIVEILKDQLLDGFDCIYVDDKDIYEKIKDAFGEEYLKKGSIKLYQNSEKSLFAEKGIDRQLKLLLNDHVSFGDEGYLIIQKTDAMHVIDVNSGACNVNAASHEEMAFKTNLFAIKEIARQLRLRDMGGIIAIDFIDVKIQAHRDAIFEAMREALADDKSEVSILPLSRFNVMMLTRERIRPVVEDDVATEACTTCHGTGKIDSSFHQADFAEKKIRAFLENTDLYRLQIHVNPLLHAYLTKGCFSKRFRMAWKYNKRVSFVIDYSLPVFDFVVFNKGKLVYTSKE